MCTANISELVLGHVCAKCPSWGISEFLQDTYDEGLLVGSSNRLKLKKKKCLYNVTQQNEMALN